MAINKIILGQDGFDRTYHKIQDVHILIGDTGKIQLQMVVASWKDKDARKSGKEALFRQCSIVGADFAMTPFYALLKAKFPDYDDGNDDFDDVWKNKAKEPAVMVVQSRDGKLLSKCVEKDDIIPDIREAGGK